MQKLWMEKNYEGLIMIETIKIKIEIMTDKPQPYKSKGQKYVENLMQR